MYLLHFERPYHHARHYQGWTTDLPARLAEHAAGRGARLLAVVHQAGIGWQLARTWIGPRSRERQLKRQGGASRRCPDCGVRPRSGIREVHGTNEASTTDALSPAYPRDRQPPAFTAPVPLTTTQKASLTTMNANYHSSPEYELGSALADADDETRQAYWDAMEHRAAAHAHDTATGPGPATNPTPRHEVTTGATHAADTGPAQPIGLLDPKIEREVFAVGGRAERLADAEQIGFTIDGVPVATDAVTMFRPVKDCKGPGWLDGHVEPSSQFYCPPCSDHHEVREPVHLHTVRISPAAQADAEGEFSDSGRGVAAEASDTGYADELGEQLAGANVADDTPAGELPVSLDDSVAQRSGAGEQLTESRAAQAVAEAHRAVSTTPEPSARAQRLTRWSADDHASELGRGGAGVIGWVEE